MVLRQEYLKRQIFNTNARGEWIGQTLEEVSVVFSSVYYGYNILEYEGSIDHTCIISNEFLSIFVTYDAFENFQYFSNILLWKSMQTHVKCQDSMYKPNNLTVLYNTWGTGLSPSSEADTLIIWNIEHSVLGAYSALPGAVLEHYVKSLTRGRSRYFIQLKYEARMPHLLRFHFGSDACSSLHK